MIAVDSNYFYLTGNKEAMNIIPTPADMDIYIYCELI